MSNVFVTRMIPGPGISMLKEKGYDVTVYPKDQIIPRKELLKKVKGADAILSLLTDRIDAELLDAAGKQLKIVGNYAVGFDNIDLAAAKKRGVLVTNTPGPEITESVAEHTFALMIALARRICEADQFTRAGKYHGWSPTMLLGTDLHGKTLGIVGLGRIGFAVAERAVKGFRMKALYHDPNRNEDFEKQYGGEYRDLPELLRESDVVTLHVPLLPATRHLISKKQLALMKPTAFLINTARGPIIDEKALLEALYKKKIAGAGIDVFECEPSTDCDPTDHMELKKLSNTVLTPHNASASIEARGAMARTAAENIIAAMEGRTPPNVAK